RRGRITIEAGVTEPEHGPVRLRHPVAGAAAAGSDANDGGAPLVGPRGAIEPGVPEAEDATVLADHPVPMARTRCRHPHDRRVQMHATRGAVKLHSTGG